MATEAQIAANRENALKHGYTGLTLVLKREESQPYATHVAAYMNDYGPSTIRQIQLVQQKADLDWSLHQISVEQANIVTHMNVITSLPPDPANPTAIVTLIAPFSRILTTLSLYEGRRRRASKSVAQELEALQKSDSERQAHDLAVGAKFYKSFKAQGKVLNPEEYGLVCSLEEILDFIKGQEAANTVNSTEDDPISDEMMDLFLKAKAQTEADLAKIMCE